MRISRFAVHRPIFTVMVVLIVIILGIISLLRLPIDLMPDITYPVLSIYCNYQNASPEEIEELICRPIEEAVSSIPGAEEITSISTEGRGTVRVKFSWGTNLDAAANDIRDRMDRVIPNLPEESERPRLRKFDVANFPILIIGASSDMDPIEMRTIIEDQVKNRIERVPGVAALDIWGGLDREIHVNLYADRVIALGVRLDQILQRIREGNINLPAGWIQRGNLEVTIRTPGVYTDLDQLRETVVAMRDGAPIRLKEIARVEDSWERVTRIVRINGKFGVRLAVNKQSGRNTVEVAKAILKEVEILNKQLPQIELEPIIDTSEYIERSITNVGTAALYGGALALVVLLFFLRNIRSTIVIATSIPVSIIATFTLMYFNGFTLNIMTLGGMALGIGMLVDNAIVVLENIHRRREAGEPAAEAAIKGTEEVTTAIIASTLTTLVVFLPLIFVQGMSGIMFKQLSVVVGFALLCSLAVALTLVPMLSAQILPQTPTDNGKKSVGRRLYILSGRFFAMLESDYQKVLRFALNHRLVVVCAAVLLLAGSLALIPLIGVELMPAADESEIRIHAEMEVGTRLGVLDEKFKQVIEPIADAKIPEATRVMSRLGGSSWRAGGSHSGQLRISLTPMSQRTRTSEQIAADMRKELQNIPGVKIRARAGQGLFLLRMGQSNQDRVKVEIRGHDLEISDFLAKKVQGIVESIPGVVDARISRELGNPEEQIVIDRQKAASMKLSVSGIASVLQTVLSGTIASYYRDSGEEYAIRVQLKDAEHLELSEILDLTMANADSEPVVLRNIVEVRPRRGPVRVERKNQRRIVTVSAEISGRDMGSVMADIQNDLEGIALPSDFDIGFGGDFEEQQKAFRELLLSCVLALVLVYMVMACQYESLRDPFVVMFSVPLAAIGVILMLFFTHDTFNVQSYIGCIMLAGIVVNNAILMVDHTNLLRHRDGMGLREAIEEAGRRRLRPILMTATTTIIGLIPLALGLGEGREAQTPMARAVIGGLLSSTLITLVIVPVVYSFFESRRAGNTGGAGHAL